MSARLEYTSEYHQFRELVRGFVRHTVLGAHERWEKAGCSDRSLFTEAAKLGLLGFSVPEDLGGPGVNDFRYNTIVIDELQRVSAATEIATEYVRRQTRYVLTALIATAC